MYLITSWRESFTLLKPSNVKLLLLVSIKASIHTYALLLKYWWWLLVVIGIADILLVGQLLVEPTAIMYHVSVWWIYAYFFIKALLWFVICLSARSSIKNKNINYFAAYIGRFFWISWLLGILIFCILGIAAALFLNLFNFQPITVSFFGIRYALAYLIVIWNFFLLDHGSPRYWLKAFINALYMIVLNFPFIIVSFILFNLILQLIKVMQIYLINALPWSVQLVLLDFLFVMSGIVMINIISTFYIKRAHDQCDIYCPR